MTYNQHPAYRQAQQAKQVEARKSPFKLFCKEQLEKYNVGLISADEYYKSVADARLLMC